jgi:hypothetical protein
MAVTVTKVDVWAADLKDEAGSLAAVLEALAGAGGNIECIIARRRHDRPGTGQLFITPIKGAKVQKAAKSVGLSPATDMATLRIETPNKAGVGQKVMAAIAGAGVNIRGISAATIGNKAVAYIGLDNKADADKAVKALRKIG